MSFILEERQKEQYHPTKVSLNEIQHWSHFSFVLFSMENTIEELKVRLAECKEIWANNSCEKEDFYEIKILFNLCDKIIIDEDVDLLGKYHKTNGHYEVMIGAIIQYHLELRTPAPAPAC